jgi:uncharacterized membrane protein
MQTIEPLIGRTLWLIVLVAVAVVVAQNLGTIMSILLAAFLMLAIARLAWPTPRR